MFEIPKDKPYGWYFRLDQRPDTLTGTFNDEGAAERAAKKAVKKRGGGSFQTQLHAPLPAGSEEEARALMASVPPLQAGVVASFVLDGNPFEDAGIRRRALRGRFRSSDSFPR